MRLNIVHTTEYAYDEPVTYGLQRLRQTPCPRNGQTIVDWRNALEGAREEVTYTDHLGNITSLISVVPGSNVIRITAGGEVDTEDVAGVVGAHRGHTPLWLYLRETALTPRTRAITALAREVEGEGGLERMHALTALIRERVAYETGATDVATTADDALAAGKGVCQDHSHIFLAAARSMGLPARYVSGLMMVNGQSRQAASHAWAEVHLEHLGWVGFDVSNGVSPDDKYVCVATGLDYRDAAPISGIRHGSASESLSVSLVVEQ